MDITSDGRLDPLLTPDELCEYLRVTGNTLRRYERDGLLVPHRLGRRKFYVASQVREALGLSAGSGPSSSAA